MKGYEEEIDLHDLCWGVTRQAPGGSGRRRVRANVRDLTVLKSYDAASPHLTLATLRGQAFDEIELTVRKDSGAAPLGHLKITMTDCVLTDCQMENGGTDDPRSVITKAVDIEFETIRIVDVPQAEFHAAGDKHGIEFEAAAVA